MENGWHKPSSMNEVRAYIVMFYLSPMNITLTKTQKILVQSSEDIARIMRQILLRENRVSRLREHLWAIGLDDEFRLLYVELLAFGIPANDKVDPVEIYQLPVHKRAKFMCLCHNRKTGDMSAKPSDKMLTDRMIQAGKILGITVFDHLIINAKSEDWLSYRDIGLMEKLHLASKWVAPFQLEKEIKKAAAKSELKFATKMVKNMAKAEMTIEQISKTAGLPVKLIISILGK